MAFMAFGRIRMGATHARHLPTRALHCAGMDLLEEVLSSGDRRRIGRVAAREGALAALARTLHMRGLGGKAAPLLAALAADGTLLAALRALLGPGDYAALAVRPLGRHASGSERSLCRGKPCISSRCLLCKTSRVLLC